MGNQNWEYISNLENSFGRFNFDAPIYRDGEFLRFKGQEELPTTQMSTDYRTKVPEKIARLTMLIRTKESTFTKADFDEGIQAGKELAKYMVQNYIPMLATDPTLWAEARGDWPFRWRCLVFELGRARKPGQTGYGKISGEVSQSDWDNLLAWFLRIEEISLPIAFNLPESVSWRESQGDLVFE